jgi:hypothetical protein
LRDDRLFVDLFDRLDPPLRSRRVVTRSIDSRRRRGGTRWFAGDFARTLLVEWYFAQFRLGLVGQRGIAACQAGIDIRPFPLSGTEFFAGRALSLTLRTTGHRLSSLWRTASSHEDFFLDVVFLGQNLFVRQHFVSNVPYVVLLVLDRSRSGTPGSCSSSAECTACAKGRNAAPL